MKKIIHLSDLHIGHKDCGARFHAIIEGIAASEKPAEDYIVVITGDIVNNANRRKQADEAAESIGLLRRIGYRVLMVPGNHDYGNGALGKRKFVSRFKKIFYGSDEFSWPRLDIIGETAFIGLDSTEGELNWDDRFFCEGELGKEQMKRLKAIFKDERVMRSRKVVYMHHHPFDYKPGMYLKDSLELKAIISKKADILLFGHYHRDPESAGKTYHGTWGIPRCYNAGSSTHKNGNTGFQRVIDLSQSDPSNDRDGRYI